MQSSWIPGPSTPPIIDGTVTAGEWAGAGSVPILVGSLPAGYVLVKNDTSTLYMILDITNDTVNDAVPMEDFFRLTVDVKADQNIEPNVDVQFMMDSSAHMARQFYLGPGSYSPLTPTPNSHVGVGFGGSPILSSPSHRMWELSISFDDIGIPPDIWTSGAAPVVRVGVRLISTNPGLNIAFPTNFETDFSDLITIYLGLPSIPIDPLAPGFKGVGHIPRSNIVAGYADTWTEPAPILRVKDAPFGSTIDVKGDFAVLGLTGSKYRIEYSKNGGPLQVLTQNWTNYQWDGAAGKYIATAIKPDTNGNYDILPAPLNDWYWTDLVMRWKTNSFGNGFYSLHLYTVTGTTYTPIAGPGGTLELLIDNTPPQVEIKEVYHAVGSSITPLDICGIVHVAAVDPTDGFRFRVKVIEDEGHLWHYYMNAHYGDNKTKNIIPTEVYVPGHVDADGPHLWNGFPDLIFPPLSSNPWKPDTGAPYFGNVCGYQFRLSARGRTINGYHRVFYKEYNRHACIEVH